MLMERFHTATAMRPHAEKLLAEGQRAAAQAVYSSAADYAVEAYRSADAHALYDVIDAGILAATLLYSAKRYTEAESLAEEVLERGSVDPEVRSLIEEETAHIRRRRPGTAHIPDARHDEAQILAAQADELLERGGGQAAVEILYGRAADLELEVLRSLSDDHVRRSAAGVSAAKLLYRANRLDDAAAVVDELLNRDGPTPYYEEQLTEIVAAIRAGRSGT